MKKAILIFAAMILFALGVNAQTRKDGMPDMRYKVNKQTYSTPVYHSPKTPKYYPQKTPDNNISYPHIKKDGTPDRRYKENRTYVSTQSSSTTPSYKYYTSVRKNKTIYYYSAGRDANGKIHRSQSATYAFKRMTGYPKGRKGYVIDHITPLFRGGCDCPTNMQWQTKEDAKQKDKWE